MFRRIVRMWNFEATKRSSLPGTLSVVLYTYVYSRGLRNDKRTYGTTTLITKYTWKTLVGDGRNIRSATKRNHSWTFLVRFSLISYWVSTEKKYYPLSKQLKRDSIMGSQSYSEWWSFSFEGHGHRCIIQVRVCKISFQKGTTCSISRRITHRFLFPLRLVVGFIKMIFFVREM